LTVRYKIQHLFNTDEATFWEKIFFDPEYNQALFVDYLKFDPYRVLEHVQNPDGSIRRRVECAPPVEIPAVARKVLGDSTAYVEEGRFDPKTRRFSIEVIPRVAADKLKSRATMWVEPRGDKKIERFVEIENEVRIFGIGKMLEAFIEKQTRDVYDEATAFTNDWIAKKGF
jgi:hypothetical protein